MMPNFIAKIMFKNHSSSKRLKEEISLINSGIIKHGDKILDFACGPGRLSWEMAKIVGNTGMVYALDIHPLAIKNIEDLIEKNQIYNIKTILTSDLKTGLENQTIDIVFIFNAIDMIRDKEKMITELERVLKPGGRLIIKNKMSFFINKNHYKQLFSESSVKFVKEEGKTYYYTKEKIL